MISVVNAAGMRQRILSGVNRAIRGVNSQLHGTKHSLVRQGSDGQESG